MAAITVVQHKSSDPNARLAQILNDPVLSEVTGQSFWISCASLDTIGANVKGNDFVYDAQDFPVSGIVGGIVLYEENMIAAQYINCDLPAERLSTAMLAGTTLESETLLSALCIAEADFIFIR